MKRCHATTVVDYSVGLLLFPRLFGLKNAFFDGQVMVVHGDSVVTTSWDETIRMWNIKSGSCLLTLRGHKEGLMPYRVTSFYH